VANYSAAYGMEARLGEVRERERPSTRQRPMLRHATGTGSQQPVSPRVRGAVVGGLAGVVLGILIGFGTSVEHLGLPVVITLAVAAIGAVIGSLVRGLVSSDGLVAEPRRPLHSDETAQGPDRPAMLARTVRGGGERPAGYGADVPLGAASPSPASKPVDAAAAAAPTAVHQDGLVPAGWYPDPRGSDARRFWDGAGWTEHLWQGPGRASPGELPAGRQGGSASRGARADPSELGQGDSPT